MAQEAKPAGIGGRIAAIVEWVNRQRPVRVMQHFNAVRGPILSSGLAFQAIFAGFAALWIGFSVAGLIVAGDVGLRETLIRFLAENVPGLIDQGGGGAVDPELLLDAGIFGLTGILASVGLVVAGLGWLASAREAVRSVFILPSETTNFFLMKLKDFGIALVLAVVLVVSTGLSVVGTQAIGYALEALGVNDDSVVAIVIGRLVTLTVMFVLDAVVLGILFRVLSGVQIPWSRLRAGILIGAVGFGLLKVLGTALLGGARNNPLLASFAVIIGLLIWFNLLCQVMLVAASWIYIGMRDRGVPVDPERVARRLEGERQLLAARSDAERIERRGVIARLIRRRRR